MCPHGGCRLPCNTQLECGHTCKMLCHPISHREINCIQECSKPRPLGCTHKCPKGCWEDCGLCTVKTKKLRIQCGHTVTLQCHIDADGVPCSERCGYSMICGHSCRETCCPTGHDTRRHKCMIPCNRTPLCGHNCPKKCFEQCGKSSVQNTYLYISSQKVSNSVMQTTGRCMTRVMRKLPCGHSLQTECHVDILTLICASQCGKGLPCGHECIQPCGHTDRCGTNCKEEVKKIVLKCRHTPSHWVKVSCDKNIEAEHCKMPCSLKLPCGHKCLGTCNDCESVPGKGGPKVHKACSQPCRKALDCNHLCKGGHRCGDISRCPPCLEPCAMKCSHRKCQLSCGVPCTPCDEPCSYSCIHMTCQRKCCRPHFCVLIGGAEETNIATGEGSLVCNERCRERLTCRHRCQGFCGEKCPSICATCEPDQYSADDRFFALGCGHAIEAKLLHAKVMGVGAPGSDRKVPACPTCDKTISGTHRYSFLVRERLRSLEPEVLLRLEEQLCRDFAADNGPVNPKIEELTAMLVSHPGLLLALSLLLGKVYTQIGSEQSLLQAKTYLLKAAAAPTSWVGMEAHTCLGHLMVCKGHPDDKFLACVETSTEKTLESARRHFNFALALSNASGIDVTVSREVFGRTSPSIAVILDAIDGGLVKRKVEKQAKLLAAEAAKRLYNTRPIAALPIEQSSPIFPSAAAPRPLFVAVTTTGGTLLHRAAAEGNIRKVINRTLY
jgi:hypothetical protein